MRHLCELWLLISLAASQPVHGSVVTESAGAVGDAKCDAETSSSLIQRGTQSEKYAAELADYVEDIVVDADELRTSLDADSAVESVADGAKADVAVREADAGPRAASSVSGAGLAADLVATELLAATKLSAPPAAKPAAYTVGVEPGAQAHSVAATSAEGVEDATAAHAASFSGAATTNPKRQMLHEAKGPVSLVAMEAPKVRHDGHEPGSDAPSTASHPVTLTPEVDGDKNHGGANDTPPLKLSQTKDTVVLSSRSRVWKSSSELLGRAHKGFVTAASSRSPVHVIIFAIVIGLICVVAALVMLLMNNDDDDDAPKTRPFEPRFLGSPAIAATPSRARSPLPSAITLDAGVLRSHNAIGREASSEAIAPGEAQSVLNHSFLQPQAQLVRPTDSAMLMDHPLCPDLVVPEANECSLLVPHLPRNPTGEGSTVTVDDQKRYPVFRVICSGREQRLRLESGDGDRVFASYRAGDMVDGALVSLALYEVAIDGRTNFWGTIAREQGIYIVTAQAGWRISVRGEFKVGGALSIVADDSGRLLATVQAQADRERSPSTKRWLRVGPLVDAGLVVTAVLATEVLEAEMARRSSPYM